MTGKNNPVYQRKKISQATRQKMSEWQKGKNNNQSKRVKCIELGLIFDTIKDAALWCGGHHCNLGKAVKNKYRDSNRYKGYTWETIND